MRRWQLFPFGTKMADSNSMEDADLIHRIMPGMDSSLSALFSSEFSSHTSVCLVVVRRAVCSLIPRASRLCLEAFRFMTTCLLVLYQAFRPSHPVRIVLSTPKCLASCKLVQFNDNAVSLLPSELKFVQSCGSVFVSGLGVIKRARSEFPTRRPGSSNANNAAGTSSTVYMIPKLSKAAQSTPDDVKGFSSDNDLATID